VTKDTSHSHVSQARTNLAAFDNSWYSPGRGHLTRLLWLVLNRIFMQTAFPWPSLVKTRVLRMFGASVGRAVVLKPRLNIKYPWNLDIGDHSWIGEDVWIDSLGRVTIGSHVCVSQGAMLETGNHDWSTAGFDLVIRSIVVEDGAWVAVRALLLPGARLRCHSVLGAASVLSGDTDEYAVYVGNPARRLKDRGIRPT
jgi:putative colanic acid biosynthesis acetyltransferase WcaF